MGLKLYKIIFISLGFVFLIFLGACLQNQGNQVTQTSLSVTNPGNGLTVSGSAITLENASASSSGALLAADFATFAAKEGGLGNPAASGMTLTSTTGGTRSWAFPHTLIDPAVVFMLHDDFISGTAAVNVGNLGWTTTVNGAGTLCSAVAVAADNLHPGVVSCTTGTTAAGRATEMLGSGSSIALGNGVITVAGVLQLPTLSDGAQTYRIYFGLGDNSGAGDQTDGIYLTYSSTLNAGNWTGQTANNGVYTQLDLGVAATTAWTKIAFITNAAGTSVQFYVNGTAVGAPVTTNLPAGGRDFAPIFKIEKSVGTTARTMLVDYYRMVQVLTTTR